MQYCGLTREHLTPEHSETMTNTLKTIESSLVDLEDIQTKVGAIQVGLLRILTDDVHDEWDDAAQQALLKLEAVQRHVGQVQISLVRKMRCQAVAQLTTTAQPPPVDESREGGQEPLVSLDSSEEQPQPEAGGATEPIPQVEVSECSPESVRVDSSPLGRIPHSPLSWLEARGITVKGVPEDNGLDDASDRAAWFLGQHFDNLQPFYEAIKRRVNGDYGKWFKVEDLRNDVLSDIIQFGNMLHDCAFLSEFKYLKREKGVLFVPLEDGRVTNFFTGNWFERYIFQIVRQEVERCTAHWHEEQALVGAQVTWPDGSDGEIDILLTLPQSGVGNPKPETRNAKCEAVLWIECKTGRWQDYVARYRDINRKFMKLPPDRAALVLLDDLTPADKSSATTLSGMTVMSPEELKGFVERAVCPQGDTELQTETSG